jgi:hypothetical protein
MKRKIKLRDMTKEQWDSYKRNVCMWLCTDCPIKAGKCFVSTNEYSWFNNKDMYSDKFLDQELEIETPDILEEAEKRYLKEVIRPFRNIIFNIKKCSANFGIIRGTENMIYYYIQIEMKSRANILYYEYIKLPYFRNSNMYKGMETGKEYTLEELDL